MREKREDRIVFSFIFSFFIAYKLEAFALLRNALLRNSIRFCAKLAQYLFIFLISESET